MNKLNYKIYTGHNGNELHQWSEGSICESPVLEPCLENPTGAYVQIKRYNNTCDIAIVGEKICKTICPITGIIDFCSFKTFLIENDNLEKIQIKQDNFKFKFISEHLDV